jgi:hypothetical protein
LDGLDPYFQQGPKVRLIIWVICFWHRPHLTQVWSEDVFSRLVIGCVDSDTLTGTITKIPFDFKHYKINFVALNVDGRQIPAKPLQPDFENAGYIRSYFNTGLE